MKRLVRFLREPLLHFAALGGLIFLLFAVIGNRQVTPEDVIIVTPERINQLVAGYRSVWKRMPTGDELDALIEEHVREEVYYRDALALGLDRNDAVVRRRLRQKMEFLTDTGSYLKEPAGGVLETYFADNEKAYRRAPQRAFQQVYLGQSPDPESITRSLSALQSNPSTDPATLGEPTLLPAELGLSPPMATDSVFGQGFYEQLAELPPGVWAGPVRSAYGVHLVQVLESLSGRTPALNEVRQAVLGDWRAAEALEIREQDYARRRGRFVVEIRRDEAQSVAGR